MARSDVSRASGSTALLPLLSFTLVHKVSLLLCLLTLLSLRGVDAAFPSLFPCLFEAAASSLSGKDLSETGSGLSSSAVFGTSVWS